MGVDQGPFNSAQIPLCLACPPPAVLESGAFGKVPSTPARPSPGRKAWAPGDSDPAATLAATPAGHAAALSPRSASRSLPPSEPNSPQPATPPGASPADSIAGANAWIERTLLPTITRQVRGLVLS